MLKNYMLKNLTKFLVPVALINSSVFAQTGFFAGGSVNIQQNAYSKTDSNSVSNANKISNLAETTKQIKNKITNTENNIKNRILENTKLEQAIIVKDIEREIIYKLKDLNPTLGNSFSYSSSPFTISVSNDPIHGGTGTLLKGQMETSIQTSKAENGGLIITKTGKFEVQYNGEKLIAEQSIKVNVLPGTTQQDVKKQILSEEAKLNNKIISSKREYRDSLYDGREELRELLVTEFNLKTELSNLKASELASIKSSASKISPSISLLAGYGVKVNNFGFITEAGVDLNFGKVGDNSKQELEVKNLYNVYLTQKVGYYFNENNLTYITGGLSIKDTKVSYKGALVNIDEKKITPNLILGVGYQRTLTKNWAMFTEFNHIVSLTSVKTEVGDVKTRSEQVRVGARYYF